jgi:hypothetical protein
MHALGVDETVPDVARMYDYYLGGSHNFPADRQAAEEVLRHAPMTKDLAISNRSWLNRVVRYLVAEAGIRQILDLGSGIPTVGNVHEVAQRIDPDVRVVYVDRERVAVAHSNLILATNPRCAVVQADIRHWRQVFGNADLQQVLNFGEPVAVMMSSVLPFIPDEDRPESLVVMYLSPLCGGSYLAISHASFDGVPADLLAKVNAGAEVYDSRVHQPVTLRGRSEIMSWFGGLDMVEPGLVPLPEWRPVNDPERLPVIAYGAVARKPND